VEPEILRPLATEGEKDWISGEDPYFFSAIVIDRWSYGSIVTDNDCLWSNCCFVTGNDTMTMPSV
jgi:hypothetical protein